MGEWEMLTFHAMGFEVLREGDLRSSVEALRSIPAAWKENPDPLAELMVLRTGERATVMVSMDAGFLGLLLHPAAKPPNDPATSKPLVRACSGKVSRLSKRGPRIFKSQR